MWVILFLRSAAGRLLRVALGLALMAYGVRYPSLAGLVLMIAGMVPLVTGIAGICLFDEIVKASSHRAPASRPREHQV
jgi:hypothetical protein